MVRIGMTDHPIVRKALDEGEINLDYLEVHGPFIEEARRVYPHKPMLLHNALYQWSLCHPKGLQFQDGETIIRERLAISHSPWYSLHLGFSAAEVDFANESMLALTPVLPPETVYERCCRVLNEMRQSLGSDMPVLVENLDYNPGGAYETVCDPHFINVVVEQTGVGLLLDLAHARISAHALQLPVEDYLSQLPLDSVCQLHVNRPLWNGSRLWDAHEDLLEPDYALLAWTLSRTEPWAITIEYNRDIKKIPTMVKRVRDLVNPVV